MSKIEIEKLLNKVPSAWKGHRAFAEWIVAAMKPKIIVDLGVDYGYTSFVFANSLKREQLRESKVIGVDNFQGDKHTTFRNTYDKVLNNIKMHDLPIDLVKKDFDVYAGEFSHKCDILHIDGLHTYDAVKNDFEHWSKHVNDDGFILMHDICVPDFDVLDFFREVLFGGFKLYFTHSAGLGILTKNTTLKNEILARFKNCKDNNKNPL